MDNQHIDPNSRDYDMSSIKMDARFTQINKEVLATIILFFVHSGILLANYAIGAKNPQNYAYVGPFPLWLFLQLCEFVLYIVAAFVLISYYYRDMDIAPRGKLYEKNKDKTN